MTLAKRYQQLDTLPAYGPMPVSISRTELEFYSAGMAVRFFKEDGSNWLANFERGYSKLEGIYELSNCRSILVIAGGTCYLMNPEESKPLKVFGGSCKTLVTTPEGRMVLDMNYALCIIETNGQIWETECISYDELTIESIENNCIYGQTYDSINDYQDWIPFTYNLNTKTLHRDSYPSFQSKSKPWWRFW